MDDALHAEVLNTLRTIDMEESHIYLNFEALLCCFYTHVASWLSWHAERDVSVHANLERCVATIYGHRRATAAEQEAEEYVLEGFRWDEDFLSDATRAVLGELARLDLSDVD